MFNSRYHRKQIAASATDATGAKSLHGWMSYVMPNKKLLMGPRPLFIQTFTSAL